MGEPGFDKTYHHGTKNTMVGAHIIGPNASELIQELVLAVNTSATAEDISRTMRPPTLSEALMETAQGVSGHFTHMLKNQLQRAV